MFSASSTSRPRLSDVLKRGLDIAGAGTGLVVASPVLAAAALGIAATMGRPVFFRQLRPGFRGTPFLLVKLRTMRVPKAGEDGVSSDPARLTRLGRVLRRTSIDELPTLWNVVKGDMSLVGPRPLLMQYLGRYTKEQARRHDVKPGITGWAQINGRNAISWEEKFALDVWYVDHWSLWLDARILWKTVSRVMMRDGIEHAGSATMPEFMGTPRSRAMVEEQS